MLHCCARRAMRAAHGKRSVSFASRARVGYHRDDLLPAPSPYRGCLRKLRARRALVRVTCALPDVAAHFHIQSNISSRAARFARGAAASRQRARQRLATCARFTVRARNKGTITSNMPMGTTITLKHTSFI